MKLRHTFFYLLPLVLLAACQPMRPKEVSVQIIQANDVYEIAPVSGGEFGGYARFASLVDSLQAKNANTLVVHAGDFLSPSLIGNMKNDEGQKIQGQHMIEVMNAVGFDAVTFGNHEFDIKEKALLSRLDESQFTWVSSNVYHRLDSNDIRPFGVRGQIIPKTLKFQFQEGDQSFTLGIVAVTLPFNQKGHVYYEDEFMTIEQILDTFQVDKVVLLTHLNRETDQELLKRFPLVPLVIGGHDHYHFMDTIDGRYLAKADANLRTAWNHTLTFNPSNQELRINSELIPIDARLKEKPSVKSVVDQWQNWANEKMKYAGFDMSEIIWEGDEVWECRETEIRSKQTNFGALVANTMTESSGAQIALLNSGSLRYDDQMVDVLTQGDILKAMPYGGPILKASISGNQLLQVLESGLIKNQGTGGYLQSPEVSREGEQWLWQGRAIEEDQSYTVVTSSFMAAGRENNLDLLKDLDWSSNDSLNGVRNDIRDLVINRLKSDFASK